jgi:hypothetical protein
VFLVDTRCSEDTVIDDSEVTKVFADFVEFMVEALDSRIPSRQREALLISEKLAWRTKALDGHLDFIRDCGGLLVEPELGFNSLWQITWKLRFWESFPEPMRFLLGQCELGLSVDETGMRQVLEVRCVGEAELICLTQLRSFIEEKYEEFAGYPVQVNLIAWDGELLQGIGV